MSKLQLFQATAKKAKTHHDKKLFKRKLFEICEDCVSSSLTIWNVFLISQGKKKEKKKTPNSSSGLTQQFKQEFYCSSHSVAKRVLLIDVNNLELGNSQLETNVY